MASLSSISNTIPNAFYFSTFRFHERVILERALARDRISHGLAGGIALRHETLSSAFGLLQHDKILSMWSAIAIDAGYG